VFCLVGDSRGQSTGEKGCRSKQRLSTVCGVSVPLSGRLPEWGLSTGAPLAAHLLHHSNAPKAPRVHERERAPPSNCTRPDEGRGGPCRLRKQWLRYAALF